MGFCNQTYDVLFSFWTFKSFSELLNCVNLIAIRYAPLVKKIGMILVRNLRFVRLSHGLGREGFECELPDTAHHALPLCRTLVLTLVSSPEMHDS